MKDHLKDLPPEVLHTRLVEAAMKKDFAVAAELTAALRAGSGATLTPLTYEKLISRLPAVRWMCKDLDLSPGRPAQLVADGGVGKSWILQSALLSVAAGLPIWGAFRAKEGPVAYLDYEMGEDTIIRRMRRLAHGMGINWLDVAQYLRVFSLPEVFMNSDNFVEELSAKVAGCSLCGIDSLRRGMPGEDENSSELTAYIDRVTKVSSATGCTFIMAHHSSVKADKTRDLLAAGRGSSAIIDASGAVYNASKKKGSDTIDVTQVRSALRGFSREPFQLTIGFNYDITDWVAPEELEEDEEADDYRPMLVTAHLDTYVQKPAAPTAPPADLTELVLTTLRRATEPMSMNSIRAAVGKRRIDVSTAVEQLIKCGQVCEFGRGASHTYRAV